MKIWERYDRFTACLKDTDLQNAIHPTNDIWIKFKSWPKFAVVWFKMYPPDPNQLHSRDVQNFNVIGWAYFEIRALQIFIKFWIRLKYRQWDRCEPSDFLPSHSVQNQATNGNNQWMQMVPLPTFGVPKYLAWLQHPSQILQCNQQTIICTQTYANKLGWIYLYMFV